MQRLAGLGLLLVAGLLLHLLAPILMPFLVATALAYLWDPAVDRLERLGMGRGLCVSLVFFLMSLLRTRLPVQPPTALQHCWCCEGIATPYCVCGG